MPYYIKQNVLEGRLGRVKLAYQTWWVSLTGWIKFQMPSSVTNAVINHICFLSIEVNLVCDGGSCEKNIYKKALSKKKGFLDMAFWTFWACRKKAFWTCEKFAVALLLPKKTFVFKFHVKKFPR